MPKPIDTHDVPEFAFRSGNSLKLLKNGDEIFPAMLSAIEAAEVSVNLETFVYWRGEIAQKFAEELAATARRGVEVRVVLDWYGSMRMKGELIETMEKGGVKVRHFRPLKKFNLRRANHRSHRKLLIVDGKTGFLGGVGIAEEWTGDAQDALHYRDNHYEVGGPVVRDMQRLFFAHWDPDDRPPEDDARFYPNLENTGELECQLIAAEPEEGDNRIERVYKEMIASARSRFLVISPYFAPNDGILDLLVEAAKRGVRIEVISAGRNNDMRVVRKAFRHDWGGLLEAGVKIYEYHRTLIHVKLLIVDESEFLVGSSNFDVRSLRLNSEASLVVRGGALDREYKVYCKDREEAEEVTYSQWKNRSLWTKAKDGAANLLRDFL